MSPPLAKFARGQESCPGCAALEAELTRARAEIKRLRRLASARGTEARLRALARFPQENPNPVLRVALRGEALYANSAGRKFLRETGWEDGAPVSPELLNAIQRALRLRREREFDISTPKGRIYNFALSGSKAKGEVNLYGRDVTERRAEQMALRQSREDLDRAQAVGQIGWWRLDTRKDLLTWSDENHRIFGVPKGTPLTYEAFLGCVHPDDRAYVHEKWSAGLRGEPYDIAHRIVADGQVKWVREKAYLEFDADGKLLGGFGITQDITSLRKAEEALRASESRYRTLFETMAEGFALHEILCDAQGIPCDYRFLEVNPAFERQTGLKAAEVVGRTLREVLPNAENIWIERYGKVALTGEPARFEHEAASLGRWYEVSAFQTEPGRFAVVFLDVTERKKAQLAVERAKKEWELTFDAMPDLIAIMDDRHRILRANKALAARLGASPQQCVGSLCYKCVHGTERTPPFCPHALSMADGQEHTAEIHEDRLGGDFIVSSTPLTDERGNHIGCVHVARDITERKAQEKALREANQLLEAVLSHTHMLVACMDRDFNFSLVNRAYARADQREPAFFQGKNHFALYPNPENEAIFRRVVETGEPYIVYAKAFEYAEHPERGVTYWDWSLIPIKDAAGAVTGVVLTLADVTPRVRAEKELARLNVELESRVEQRTADLRRALHELNAAHDALESSEAKYRQLVEGANSIILRRRTDGIILFMNRFGLEFFGFAEDELIGRNIIGTIVPRQDSQGRDLAAMIHAISENPEHYAVNENENVKRNGERVWVSWSNRAIRDGRGQVAEILAIGNDMTLHRRMEQALAESEEKFRTLAEESPNMIFIHQRGRLAYANRRCEELTGRTREALASPHFDPLSLCAPECVDNVRHTIQALSRSEDPAPGELTLVTQDTRRMEVLVATRIVRYGGERAVLGIVTDITAQKQARRDLDLRNRQLREMGLRLAKFHEQERRRVASWLHDEFGQLLSAATMRLAALRKSGLPDHAAALTEEAADLVRQTTSQMREIIYELDSPTLHRLGLREALEELCEHLTGRFGLPFHCECGEGATTGVSELDSVLYHAVREMLYNTAKHAKAGKASVRVAREENRLCLVVEDDGKGFDPQRIDHSFTRAGGFGLYRMHEQIETLGGTLAVQSQPGQGTRVVVDMPVAAANLERKP